MARLLVSVQSSAEAEAALAGGADLIDVKAPNRGSLGRADASTVLAVVAAVAGRRPISAALGELAEQPEPFQRLPLAFAKWGLAGLRRAWRTQLEDARERLFLAMPGCQLIVAAYADWQRAKGPPVQDLCSWACEQKDTGLLIDTWQKDGQHLLDWMTLETISEMTRHCQRTRTPIALAGSLTDKLIASLSVLAPDWFAVRGAACRGLDRNADIDPEAVQRLAQLLRFPATA